MNADHYNAQYAPQYPTAGYPAHGGQYAAAPGYPVQQPGMAQAPYAPFAPQPGYAYQALQTRAYPAQQSSAFFNFSNDRFLKGLLIGAAATYILTNESVQRTAIKGVVKAWSMMQGGVEELKERFQDAEAELRAAEAVRER